jgi:hypothetical protein
MRLIHRSNGDDTMNLTRFSIGVLGLLVLADQQAGIALADKDEPKKDKPKFTISKETTFVTGPLDNDGYIDYPAALRNSGEITSRLPRSVVSSADRIQMFLLPAFSRTSRHAFFT